MGDQDNQPNHMSPDEFRREALRAVDLVASYMQQVQSLPAKPGTKPGDVFSKIPTEAQSEPGEQDEWSRIFEEIESLILPNMMHWQSPSFFGFFPCNSTGPAIIGELLSAGLGQQGMLWQTSPASNELERALLDQMGRAMGLPESFISTSDNGGGCIQSTASEATLTAMVAGRRRVTERGADFHKTTVYASTQTHSSFVKAALIAGLAASAEDTSRVRSIAVNEQCEMDLQALERSLREDMASGLTPAMVCATLGTTGTTAIDDLSGIVEVLKQTGAADAGCWLHVDAAHAGALLVCPEHRAMIDGIEHADSMCFNPHKWLLVNFDCDLFWTSDRRSLVNCMSVMPEYLRNKATDTGEVFDYRDWGVPLGRKFRSLKLWLVLRHYGLSGLQAHVRAGLDQADIFESLVRADDRFEVLMPRTMNLVCIALKAGDEANRRLMELVNNQGPAFLTHTSIPMKSGDRYAIRVSIGATTTRTEHIRQLFDQLAGFADEAVVSAMNA
ncbi:MAG: aspartate aminotransferase family protein [Phycisphaerales bacterium]